jgi:hypothetical protein
MRQVKVAKEPSGRWRDMREERQNREREIETYEKRDRR